MSKERFSYLQSGQTVSEQKELQRQLQQGSTAVLSVCRFHLEQSLDRAAGLQRTLLDALEKTREILLHMMTASKDAAERLPRSVGFFVSEEDRQRTLLCTVRLLGLLDPLIASLRQVQFTVSATEGESRACLASFLQAERHLRAVITAADASFSREAGEMLTKLQKERAAFDDLCRDRTELSAFLKDFCGGILPGLSRELSFHADLEEEGKECSIARVHSTLGVFRHTAEQAHKRLLSLFSEMDQTTKRTGDPEQRRTE